MPDMTASRVGGSFAPTLDAARLDAYRKLAAKADPQVADAMNSLVKMVETYHARPAPKKGAKAPAGAPHGSGRGEILALPEEEIKRIWDVVPWQDEVTMLAQVFDRIDAGKDKATRDAAFHLLWVAQELTLDREPIFSDRL